MGAPGKDFMASRTKCAKILQPVRGRDVLGMMNFELCRKPGRSPETSVSSEASGYEQPEQQKCQGESTCT